MFFAAFISLTAWIGWVGYQRRSEKPDLEWLPAGYRQAIVGIAIFAVGGISDGIWHTAFGVEVGIDALLSPTHLILFSGALILIWSPYAPLRPDRTRRPHSRSAQQQSQHR